MNFNTKLSIISCFFLGIALYQSDNILTCIRRILLYTHEQLPNTESPPSMGDHPQPIRSYGFRLSANGQHIVPVAARPHVHQPANHRQLTDEHIFDMLAKSATSGDPQGDAHNERCQQDPRCA